MIWQTTHHPLQRKETLEYFYISLHHYVSVGQDPLSYSHDDTIRPDATVAAQQEAHGVAPARGGMGARYGNVLFILRRIFDLFQVITDIPGNSLKRSCCQVSLPSS